MRPTGPRTRAFATLGLLLTALMALSTLFNVGARNTDASSHREAPLISQDPAADGTDLYAFVSPDAPDTVTFIANYYPMQDPAGFPNFYRFGDDVIYRIHIDNNGDAIEDIIYQFDFDTTVANGDTFLYNTGPIESLDDENINVSQTYTLTELRGGGSTVLAEGLPVPPSNIGPASLPDYDAVANEAITELDNGLTVFAGQRDDPFWVDLGGIGDLLTIRELPGNAGGGVDDLAGLNVQTLAVQVPIEQLTNDGAVPEAADAANAVIGVWTTASRFSTTVIGTDGSRTASGELVQVSRLGMPLVNEVVAPLGAKDLFNASAPTGDAQFLPAVQQPELAGLLNALFGIEVPEGDRADIVAVFLTGVEGLNQPPDVVPSEQLRLNMAIAPADDPDPLGVIAGDTAGFPNGRRLIDEVVDIELRVVAGILQEDFNIEPNNQLGDGVPANDLPFLDTFPYVASPHNGLEHVHHLPSGDVAEPDEDTTPEAEETPEAAEETPEAEPTEEAVEETPEAEETAEPEETAAPEETEEAAEETPEAEETEAAAADSITLDLAETDDSGISGTAELVADGEQTVVTLSVDGATGGHPVHIHSGTCNTLGDVEFPLTDIDENGESETTVEISLNDLVSGEYAINAHLSQEEIAVYVACGNISQGS